MRIFEEILAIARTASARHEASRDEELENAMTELAVAQSHAAASQSAADRATAHVEGLDANRENIGTGNYDYAQWSADVAAANTEVSQIATAEAAARTARTTAGNATIAAAKTENAAIRAAAEQAAEVQYKNDTTWNEVDYLATIFDLEASYVYALMENLDTGLEAALDKYLATVEQAEQVYDDEMCRLDGRYYDAMNLIPSGGTIDANFYANGATSVNVQVCFAAGTPVLLADGSSKAIEKIEVGDMVLARHHENPTGELMQCKVVRVFQNGSKKTYKLTFESGFTVQATPEHPFYVKDQGWVSCENLEIGTTCVSAENTPQTLVSKELESEPVPVYNFEVENAHTYFVGENRENVLVHNICGELLFNPLNAIPNLSSNLNLPNANGLNLYFNGYSLFDVFGNGNQEQTSQSIVGHGFTDGTVIVMGDGSTKNVEDIQVGDIVLAVPDDDVNAEAVGCTVTDIYQTVSENTVVLQFVTEEGEILEIRAAEEQLFCLLDGSWTTASEMEVNQMCLTTNGVGMLLIAKTVENVEQVFYVITVDNRHTFYVGNENGDALLVHNEEIDGCKKCDCTKNRIVIPPYSAWATTLSYVMSKTKTGTLARDNFNDLVKKRKVQLFSCVSITVTNEIEGTRNQVNFSGYALPTTYNNRPITKIHITTQRSVPDTTGVLIHEIVHACGGNELQAYKTQIQFLNELLNDKAYSEEARRLLENFSNPDGDYGWCDIIDDRFVVNEDRLKSWLDNDPGYTPKRKFISVNFSGEKKLQLPSNPTTPFRFSPDMFCQCECHSK